MQNILGSAADETLIFHGENDGDVPISESEEVDSSYENVTLICVPNADHGFAAADDPDLETEESHSNVQWVINQLSTHLQNRKY